ncbi:signal peptide peptidase SppA [Rickettsia conorii subsp. heilongjiangensis]|uniref:Signal peptide peptidase SppA n=1 Tax=Rickettsia conorii subsp. heilongjiangensis TaxID=226665 RepID=A0AAD1LSJ7_RICCR|nr:signal peptide peptidase SppA [Rickettsia conorii]AEK74728.1 protease IV [Rickettsia conorii subsp. heilongjiangensis 054]BBM91486.1 signal peptide peptidase SppA [Rickettsia conorii subsp. heilongjiangensis]BBM92695.1 signal peptide peptidase SppA [Rickettsia conorii subsp. heilongjiangensis]BBM93904.1 signal peptide peptidase SppA [Rickettsia conorii subsp. heilongjiangensis]BBM95113.1 signal peptide peptidase SppA [Rickettsia conorii subsp. heilongjiangensis]
MSITPDYLIERRQIKSRLLIWKLAAIILIAIVFLLVGKDFAPKEVLPINSNADYIASVLIDEIILEDEKRDKRLKKIIDDSHIKALIVNVNSPGGTVVGAEKIYNILRKISAKKPVVIVMGTMAASGGYLISLGGDYIISHNGTITGSIGVILQTAEVTELAQKLGIKFNNFKSGELKAVPNPTEKLTEAVRVAIMENIEDTYNFFLELVSERRNLPIEEVKKLADGRVYSGRQALKLKLVDAIGSEDTALKWLQEVQKINVNLLVKDYQLKPKPKLIDIILEDFDSIAPSFFKNSFNGIKAIF